MVRRIEVDSAEAEAISNRSANLSAFRPQFLSGQDPTKRADLLVPWRDGNITEGGAGVIGLKTF